MTLTRMPRASAFRAFRKGFLSAFGIGLRRAKQPRESAESAIEHDWRRVGDDLREAMKRHEPDGDGGEK